MSAGLPPGSVGLPEKASVAIGSQRAELFLGKLLGKVNVEAGFLPFGVQAFFLLGLLYLF